MIRARPLPAAIPLLGDPSMKPLRSLLAWSPVLLAVAGWEAAAFWSDSQFVPHLPTVAQVIVGSAWHDPIIQSQGGGRYGYVPHAWATLRTFLFCFTTG